jgi:hypothetical protein
VSRLFRTFGLPERTRPWLTPCFTNGKTAQCIDSTKFRVGQTLHGDQSIEGPGSVGGRYGFLLATRNGSRNERLTVVLLAHLPPLSDYAPRWVEASAQVVSVRARSPRVGIRAAATASRKSGRSLITCMRLPRLRVRRPCAHLTNSVEHLPPCGNRSARRRRSFRFHFGSGAIWSTTVKNATMLWGS